MTRKENFSFDIEAQRINKHKDSESNLRRLPPAVYYPVPTDFCWPDSYAQFWLASDIVKPVAVAILETPKCQSMLFIAILCLRGDTISEVLSE